MKKSAVNIVFPIILFLLLCVAVVAIVTAPRSTGEPENTGRKEPVVTGEIAAEPADETEPTGDTEPTGA